MRSTNERRFRRISLRMGGKKPVIGEIKAIIDRYKNIVVSGEVGVGKITSTLEAIETAGSVYYIGNPVDYVGKPRPKGYDKYINYILTLRKNLHVISSEEEILSFDFSSLSGKGAILLIDEIYGRSAEQYQKIYNILDTEGLKVILIAGCLKNIGKIIQKFDIILMIIHDGILLLDKDFVMKICMILGSDPMKEQAALFK